MTDKKDAQPEALRLAGALEQGQYLTSDAGKPIDEAATELRRQHAEIQQLKAQLSARQAAPDGWRLAAQAVIDRWDSPLWRQEVGTNTLINDLRAALSAAPPPPEREPQKGVVND